ncbi:MAG: hypothetical protein IT285_03565 [Bdellovibrionales bacterium]|nr:hypothetical protein [Bdellovibrionales bacterium]
MGSSSNPRNHSKRAPAPPSPKRESEAGARLSTTAKPSSGPGPGPGSAERDAVAQLARKATAAALKDPAKTARLLTDWLSRPTPGAATAGPAATAGAPTKRRKAG